MLKKHMVAYRIHEGAEALRLSQAAVLSQYRQNAGKGLLADIFNGLCGLKPGAKLELEQFREVAGEVLLYLVVSGTETCNIVGIE